MGLLDEALLVVAATNNKEVNHRVYLDAKEKGIPVNIVDAPDLCDFIIPSKVERGDLLISISTNGKSPALSKKIRKKLQEEFGEEYKTLLDLMGEIRAKAMESISEESDRVALFENIINSDILDLLKEDNIQQARDKAYKLFESYVK